MFLEVFNELLEDNQLSAKSFSKECGIPYTTINGWLSRKRLPSYEALEKISNYFSISTDALFGREGMQLITLKKELAPIQRQMLTTFNQLAKEDQYQVLGFAMALAN